jgi:hypothetical protein
MPNSNAPGQVRRMRNDLSLALIDEGWVALLIDFLFFFSSLLRARIHGCFIIPGLPTPSTYLQAPSFTINLKPVSELSSSHITATDSPGS